MVLANMMFRKFNGGWIARRCDWQFFLVEEGSGWVAHASSLRGDVKKGIGPDAAGALLACMTAVVPSVNRAIAEMDKARGVRRGF